jgi:hypothetical protein
MNETIFFAFPSGALVYQMDETDEIDEISSTIYRFNGEIKIKNISYIKGMGLVGCDRSMLHTSKHIKRKETLET